MAKRQFIVEFDAVTGPIVRNLNAVERAVASAERNILASSGRIEKGVNGIMTAASRLQNVSGIIAGGFGVAMVTNFVDQSTKIRNALRAIGQDSEENFNALYLASTRALSDFPAFADTVRRFYLVLGESQSFDQTIRQVETLNKLLALSGKSTEERMSVVRQFSQALQKGVLNSDELTSLRENAPVELLRALERQAGATGESLSELSKSGRLTSDVMIAALNELAGIADSKMKGVQVTFHDAAIQMRNGAIVAAQAFDEASGLSRAGVGAIKALGEVLAQSAEAFAVFGQAAKVAAVIFATAYGGRRLQNITQAFTAFYDAQTLGVQRTVAAAQADAAATAAVVAQKQKAVLAIQAKIAAQTKETASAAQVASATRALTTAENALTVAKVRDAEATAALALANARLNGIARATAGTMGILRGAMAFLGGVPGLLLAAGTAMYFLAQNARTLQDVLDEAAAANDNAKSAASALADVQDRLNEAVKEYGNSSDQAHRRVIANLQAELFLHAAKLEMEVKAQQETQRTQRIELGAAIARRENAEGLRQQAEEELASLHALGFGDTDLQVIGANSAIREAQQAISVAKGEVELLNLSLMGTGIQLDNNNAQLETTKGILAGIAAENAMGQVEAGASALHGWLDKVAGRLDHIGGTSLPDPFGAMIDGARRLLGYLSGIVEGFATLPGYTSLNRHPDSAGKHREAMDGPDPVSGLAPTTSPRPGLKPIDFDFEPEAAGGGSSGRSDWEEALSFIEQMMTEQERQEQQLREILAIREQIVKTYGKDSEQVAQLDGAIEKFKEEMQGANDALTQLFDTMADSIASSIEDWKGWGNLVRSILASLVRTHGVDFFTALLTPGKQAGGGLGTILGNGLGGLFGGGAAAAAANIPAAKAAIQKSGPQGITIIQNNDFRNADPGAMEAIKAQLNKRDRELPGRVIEVIRDAKRRRVSV